MDYTVYAATLEQQQERQIVEASLRTRKELSRPNSLNEGIDRKNDLLQELGSARSESRCSSVSSNALRAHAREDDMAFARKKREEEARLESLRAEQEAAVAVARVKAIDEELGLSHEYQLPDLLLEEPSERVQKFINSQLKDSKRQDPSSGPGIDTPNLKTPGFRVKTFKKEKPDFTHALDPGAQPFPPSHTTPTSAPVDRMDYLVQFMARRELIANKIEKFDNRPENYNTWKAAFKNMTRDVISASEELALIIEFTTGESKRLVQRLHNAYIEKPAEGIRESWKKLGERFDSTAVITQVHLNKLTMFPMLCVKDNRGLQELGDLLLELQCARDDGGLAGLKILDEPAFLKTLLIKLPEDLQVRWQRYAYRYKSNHGVDYPLFQEFASFIQETARERNDPYLSIESPERKNLRQVKPPTKPPAKPPMKPADIPYFGRGLTVFNINVSDPAPRDSGTRDPAKWCIVHKLCHPLSKCRAFRAMSLAERRNLLSQHGKDCVASVKCTGCQGDKHIAALHAGPPSEPAAQHRELGDAHQQGGEATIVTASCTEVCGKTTGGKSCSKICPANIYVCGHPENKIKAYVVIDDQSNCSLAKPKLFDLVKLGGKATTYMLKTCSETSQAKGRRVHNLIIEYLDSTQSHTLPVLTECDAIRDSREEIPIPTAARAHPHLTPIADKIPELDPEAEILLLVGRNAPPLHKIHESRNGPRNAPWAQRLDLGFGDLGKCLLGRAHKPSEVSSFKTQALTNGRPFYLLPCRLYIKHDSSADSTTYLAAKGKELSTRGGLKTDWETTSPYALRMTTTRHVSGRQEVY